MSEAEKFRAAEASLKLLAARLNLAADLRHPVKQKHLEIVRAAVREQWAAKQNKIKRHAAKSSQQASATKKKSKSQSTDYGHSHSSLKLLATRLNLAADLRHPVKEKHLEIVRAAVREQWEAKQNKIKKHAAKFNQQASATKKKSKSQSKDYGHSH